jgi:hypothetical protein
MSDIALDITEIKDFINGITKFLIVFDTTDVTEQKFMHFLNNHPDISKLTLKENPDDEENILLYFRKTTPINEISNTVFFIENNLTMYKYKEPNIFIKGKIVKTINKNDLSITKSTEQAMQEGFDTVLNYITQSKNENDDTRVSFLNTYIKRDITRLEIEKINTKLQTEENRNFTSNPDITPLNMVSYEAPELYDSDAVKKYDGAYFYEKEMRVEIKQMTSFSEQYAAARKIDIKSKIESLISRINERIFVIRQIEDLIENEHLFCGNYSVFYINYSPSERLFLDIINVVDLIVSNTERPIENPILYYDKNVPMSNSLFGEDNILMFISIKDSEIQKYSELLSSKYPTYDSIGDIFKELYEKHFNDYCVLAQLFIPKNELSDFVSKNGSYHMLIRNPNYNSICYFSHFGRYGYKILLDDIYISVLRLIKNNE